MELAKLIHPANPPTIGRSDEGQLAIIIFVGWVRDGDERQRSKEM